MSHADIEQALGVELKLVPIAGKHAAWLRGVMPGYWRRDVITQTTFNEDGFYNLGDAMKPAGTVAVNRPGFAGGSNS